MSPDCLSEASGRRARVVALVAGVLVTALLSLSVVSGCGNYSNEDLEYMNAVPTRDLLAVEVPVQGAILRANTAEGWRTTWSVIQTYNRVADGFLGLIDHIRSFYPTRREPNARIWGPLPDEQHPRWQIQFTVSRDANDPGVFRYDLVSIPPAEVLPPATPSATASASVTIISGTFAASGGVKRGTGRMDVTLAEARELGITFGDLERLEWLSIEYQNDAWPHHVRMQAMQTPPTTNEEARSSDYTYEREATGAGSLQFSWVQDLVPGAAGLDTLRIESLWQATGQGRADVAVVEGDLAGSARSIECWANDFTSTYKSATWAPPPVGDETTCIAAP